MAGLFTIAYIVIKNKIAKLPKDVTWFSPLWQDFLDHYDAEWDTLQAKLKKKGQDYTNIKVDSSQTMGPGAVTNVHICGNRSYPVLLLLPGYRGTSTMWSGYIEELVTHYCVVTLDYPFDIGRSTPGHEKTPIMDRHGRKFTKFTYNDKSVEGIMAWMREVLKKVEIPELSAMGGYSLGAYLTSMMALNKFETLRPNAKLFLGAPPATFSTIPFFFMLSLILPSVWAAFTGLPISISGADMAKNSYESEMEAGTAEAVDFYHTIVKQMERGDQITQFIGSTPLLPFHIRKFSDEELKIIGKSFNATYLCLEWDNFYNADTAVLRAQRAGFQTMYVEKSTHMFCGTQPKHFSRLMTKALTG